MATFTSLTEVLRQRGFWKAYYSPYLLRAGDVDTADEVFGDDDDFADARLWGVELDELGADLDEDNPVEGATLDVPFPERMHWRFCFSPQPCIAHVLVHEDTPETPVLVGYEDAHAAMPILRWSEVRRLGVELAHVWDAPGSPMPSCFALPLFMPTTWLANRAEAEEARALLSEAWTKTGLLTPGAIEKLVDASCWTTQESTWVEDDDPACGVVCRAKHSLRQPGEDAAFVLKAFFDALAPHARPSASPEEKPAVTNAPRASWRDGLRDATVRALSVRR